MEHSTRDYSCTLYKQQNSSWLEYCRPASLQISAYGLSFRDTSTVALICDFPYNSIMKVEIFEQKKLSRFHVKTGEMANEVYGSSFHNAQDMNALADDLTRHNIVCNRMSSDLDAASSSLQSSFPSLDDQDVCDYIIQLLFNNDYQKFVHSVRELLNAVDDL